MMYQKNDVLLSLFEFMYKKIIKPLLFSIDPETVHDFSFFFIKNFFKIPGLSLLFKKIYSYENPSLERELMGLKFKNPVGLAAGFDKNAELYSELSIFGFGFIEIGTLTPLPQKGNPKKRIFRLIDDNGLINRLGFNNKGVDYAIQSLKKNKNILIGGNIGKNKSTKNSDAFKDYKLCYNKLYPYVDYFVINVSSPNTPNLRDLQEKKPLELIIRNINLFNKKQKEKKPILIKISPDTEKNQLDDIIDIVKKNNIDGIIATNTSVSRDNLKSKLDLINQKGGLSGKPIFSLSNNVIKYIYNKTKGKIPIIGVGGIMCPDDAIEKLKSGASLIQLYTGFIYGGPSIIKKINKRIIEEKLFEVT